MDTKASLILAGMKYIVNTGIEKNVNDENEGAVRSDIRHLIADAKALAKAMDIDLNYVL